LAIFPVKDLVNEVRQFDPGLGFGPPPWTPKGSQWPPSRGFWQTTAPRVR